MTSECLHGEESPVDERKEETSKGVGTEGFPDLLPLGVDPLI